MFYIEITSEDREKQQFRVPENGLTIGRDISCDIMLECAGISRTHARIGCDSGHCYIKDAGSQNGLLINGEKTQFHWLRHGDNIQIPHYRIRFFSDKAPGRDENEFQLSEKLSGDIDRSVKSIKKRTKSSSRAPRPHIYAVASAILALFSALHWAFVPTAVILAAIALKEIRVKGTFSGKTLAIIAMCGALGIGGANLFMNMGGVQFFVSSDSIEQKCRQNLSIIHHALENYKQDHDGAYPGGLSALYPGYVPHRTNLVCPGTGSDRPGEGYKYAGRAAANADPEEVILVDEGVSNHDRRGALALSKDGSIARLMARDYEHLRIQYEWMD